MNLKIYKNLRSSSALLIILLLIAAAFSHLWNLIGFPEPLFDEGVYIGRAMHVLQGLGPQEFNYSHSYDHPYFGQLLLAGALAIIGYPNSLHPSADGNIHSIEILWLFPRIFMGIFAVVDTFIIYMISERLYNRRVALIASILFAVMPITLLTRWILLDAIQLPFILSSILFAVYSKGSTSRTHKSNSDIKDNKKKIPFILLSGMFLGLAIFTKIPAFTMIPLVSFVILTNGNNSSNRNWKILGLWFIPIILVPLIWPAYAASIGEFDRWLDGIYNQSHREEKNLPSIFDSINYFFNKDPILFVLGAVGIIFRAIKRDFILLLWAFPLLVFFYFIGLMDPNYLIALLPIFCIGAGALIIDLSNKVRNKKVVHLLPFVIIAGIGIFGLVTTAMVITKNVTSPYFEAEALVVQYLEKNDDNHDKNVPAVNNNNTGKNKITLISSPSYSWIPRYVFQLKGDYKIYEDDSAVKTNNVLLVVDKHFVSAMLGKQVTSETPERVRKMYMLCSGHIISTLYGNTDMRDWISVCRYGNGSPIPSGINLIDKNHTWNAFNQATVSQGNDSLTIKVATNSSHRLFNRAYLQTELYSQERPILILSLDYVSRSLAGNAKFLIEIRSNDSKSYIWSDALANTFGTLTEKTFIIPGYIVDKPVEFRIYVLTDKPGSHEITIKKAAIV